MIKKDLVRVFLLMMISSVTYTKHATFDYTSDPELRSYLKREAGLDKELSKFQKSRDFSERNLQDLLRLLELEMEAISYLLTGPKWQFKQTTLEKKTQLKKATPTIKKLFRMSVSIGEAEAVECKTNEEYLRSIRTSLKRLYAKVRVLDGDLMVEPSLIRHAPVPQPRVQQVAYAPVPQPYGYYPVMAAPVMHVPVAAPAMPMHVAPHQVYASPVATDSGVHVQTLANGARKHADRLQSVVNRLDTFTRTTRDKKIAAKTTDQQAAELKNLVAQVKEKEAKRIAKKRADNSLQAKQAQFEGIVTKLKKRK